MKLPFGIFVTVTDIVMHADLQMLQHAKCIKTGHKSQKHSLNFPIPNLLLAIETQPQTEMRSTLRGNRQYSNYSRPFCCVIPASYN